MKKLISLMFSISFVLVVAIPVHAQTNLDARLASMDPKLVKVVEEDAPNAERWWDWYFDLPEYAAEGFSRSELREWLGGYSKLSEEGKLSLNYNPLYYAEEVDPDSIEQIEMEYNPQERFQFLPQTLSLMPTGGYEHPYDFDLWEPHKNQANCYAYAMNTYSSTDFADPLNHPAIKIYTIGYYYGFQNGIRYQKSISEMRKNLTQYLAADAEYYNHKVIVPTNYNTRPGYRQYKIAVVFSESPIKDFHFYRQDQDGYWSQKHGLRSIQDRDESSYFITDPKQCDRDASAINGGNYTIWSGYYMVTY